MTVHLNPPRGDYSGAAPNLDGAAGEYWSVPSDRGTLATAVGLLYVKRIYVPRTIAIDRIGASVTVAAASSTITLGVYEDVGTGHDPGVPLVDAGTIDGNSATAQEKTIAATLQGGRLYWLAALVQGGTPTVRADTTDPGWVGRQTNLASALGTTLVSEGRYRASVVGTALPSPAATTTILNSLFPTIAVRLA